MALFHRAPSLTMIDRVDILRLGASLMLWVRLLKYVGQTKRTAQLGRTHELAGRFLFGGDTPLKTDQLGAAGWDLRSGTWLPAAQGTLYSTKGQGFLPGRTGLNPLDGIPLATRGFEEIGRKPSSLRQGLRV